jgi:hypothetical protein
LIGGMSALVRLTKLATEHTGSTDRL